MSPIALDAQAAATRTLVIAKVIAKVIGRVIAKPCTGQRVPGARERATVQLPEPEISGLQVRVMAAGRGSRAAADTVLRQSGAAVAGASVVVAVEEDSAAAGVAVVGVAPTSG
jgi:hypothetical protein